MLCNQIRLLTNDKYKPEIIGDMPTQVFKLVQINQNPTSITFKAQSSELYFSDMLMAYSLHPLTDQELYLL